MQKCFSESWMLSVKSFSSRCAVLRAGPGFSRPAITTRSTPFCIAQRPIEYVTRSFTTQFAVRETALTDELQASREIPSDATASDIAQSSNSRLPALCPGCGAPGQNVDADAPGYYDLGRGRMMGKSGNRASKAKKQEEDEIVRRVLAAEALKGEYKDSETLAPGPSSSISTSTPLCERCHDLRYQSRGTSIVHPSMKSIQEIIEESPHSRNHIYHVLDAADFPMSLIPNLQHTLRLPRMRTQNRRSKHRNYIGGRTAEVSFIITRSDLLAPQKEQVDTLMPYLTEVLRDALGRRDKKLRLGNVRCVSAQRGWWTKTVKEEIYDRGGAGWMVGKVNVGKSALFEVVFPKGRNQDEDVNPDRRRLSLEKDTTFRRLALQETDQNSSVDTAADDEKSEVDMAFFSDMSNDSSLVGQNIKDSGKVSPKTETMEPSGVAPAEPWKDIDPPHLTSQMKELEDDLGVAQTEETTQAEEDVEDFDDNDDLSLLPPAQQETAFPEMPLVSALPGTTASPIRIPFGKGKGELIDLPGVNRSSLDAHVQDAHKKDMVMRHRVVPDQHSIKPTQSLLLGGLIRITPRMDEDCVLLAYPFVPPAFAPHLTGTHKAVAIQTGAHSSLSHKFAPAGEEYRGNISSIATPSAKTTIKSAGVFPLQWDVTKRRTGSLTDRTAGKRKATDLPFTVHSADILIEGVGWVELVCQVRKRRTSSSAATPSPHDTAPAESPVLDALSDLDVSGTTMDRGQRSRSAFPEVEVFTPEGKFIAMRQPMNAWLLGGKKTVPVHKRRERPRQTISKLRRREGSVRVA
nr:genetic interactor of prohibitins 3, mitochondrial [Quercus suber]